jgi:hypothetical protein
LQSTNEELETSKEEIQSSNEELATVNDELNNRNAEMNRVNNDLVNLIASVQMPIVMLGPDLRVRTASDSFYQTYRVEPGETIGRLLYDLGNGQWNIPALRRLLEELLPRDAQVDNFEVEHEFEQIGKKRWWVSTLARQRKPLALGKLRQRRTFGAAAATPCNAMTSANPCNDADSPPVCLISPIPALGLMRLMRQKETLPAEAYCRGCP